MGTAGHSGAFAKTLFHGIQRVAIGIACIAAIVLGLYLAYLEKVSAASACFTAGIILFLLSNIELFESIKAPGIQAKMKTIDSKVREVEELAAKVAKTSTITAEFCMEMMARVGRASGPIPREQVYAMVKGISDQLLDLGVERGKVDELLASWRSLVVIDLLRPAVHHLSHRLEQLRQGTERLHDPNPDSQQHKLFQERMALVAGWSRRLHSSGEERGARRLTSLQSLFQEIIDTDGKTAFEDHDLVAESLRHAQYFVEKSELLDMKYWLSA
jgi:hypothetical protein